MVIITDGGCCGDGEGYWFNSGKDVIYLLLGVFGLILSSESSTLFTVDM